MDRSIVSTERLEGRNALQCFDIPNLKLTIIISELPRVEFTLTVPSEEPEMIM